MKRRLFVIAGPSAIGKSYLMRQLVELYPNDFVLPPLITTRASRPDEQALDRTFVSEADYKRMFVRNEFMWADSFYGNSYGYTHASITPVAKHIAINALPPMVPEFSKLREVIMIGMTIAPDHLDLLERRLVDRGDPAEAVQKRTAAWQHDIELMSEYEPLINDCGKLFTITDDDTVATEIMPYITKFL